jgi:hypothetical protein
MKLCKKCNENKPLDSFYNRSSGFKDGKYSYCIECTKADQLKYRDSKEQKINAIKRVIKWKENNPEKFKAHNRRMSKRRIDSLSDDYIAGRIKGNKKSILKNSDIKKYPELINAYRENLKIIRNLNQQKDVSRKAN